MASGQLLAVGVHHNDVIGPDLGPHQPARVEQKAPAGIGQFQAEMVAHAFGQAMVGGGAQGQRQVGAQAAHGGGKKVVVVHGLSLGRRVAGCRGILC